MGHSFRENITKRLQALFLQPLTAENAPVDALRTPKERPENALWTRILSRRT